MYITFKTRKLIHKEEFYLEILKSACKVTKMETDSVTIHTIQLALSTISIKLQLTLTLLFFLTYIIPPIPPG